jgi:hypothetical protein
MKKRFTDYLKLTEGYKILPPIDADHYPEIDGLEGPFRTLSGAVVYYDPKEGSYYDKDKDMYLSYNEFRELDTDYSGMRDERDEVKENSSDFEKISLSDKSKLMKMVDDMGGEWVQLRAHTPDGEVIAYMDPVDDDGDRIYYDYYVKTGLMQEGNEFAHELKKARDSNKDEFEVDGKRYPVKENHKDGTVGYVELFFADRDGEEKSMEVEVTMVNGKPEVTNGMPGPEDDMYWDDDDIEEQLQDALRNGDIEWMNESAELSRIKQLAGL